MALKNGAGGAILWAETDTMTEPAPPVEAVDTTGAGDSFDAGFISAMIEGLPSRLCLQRAVLCGSLSTRSFGGTAAQATRGDLMC